MPRFSRYRRRRAPRYRKRKRRTSNRKRVVKRRKTRRMPRYINVKANAMPTRRVKFEFMNQIEALIDTPHGWGVIRHDMANLRDPGLYWSSVTPAVHPRIPVSAQIVGRTPLGYDEMVGSAKSGQFETWVVDKSEITYTHVPSCKSDTGQFFYWGTIKPLSDSGSTSTYGVDELMFPKSEIIVADCLNSGYVHNVGMLRSEGAPGASRTMKYARLPFIKKYGPFTDLTQFEGHHGSNNPRHADAAIWIGKAGYDSTEPEDPILLRFTVKATYWCTLQGVHPLTERLITDTDL